MIKVFYGENRGMAEGEIREFLGENYEVVEGAEMKPEELTNVFLGATLFDTGERRILIRDLLANKLVQEELPAYVDSPHKIAILELKLDKRSNIYKSLKDKVEFFECKMPRDVNAGVVFDVFNTAKRDGQRAVSELRKVEQTQDPMMFFGLMVSQAMKDFSARPKGGNAKKVLTELAKLDIELKSTGVDPWLLIESFLTRLAYL